MVKIISCLIHFLHTFRKLLYKFECFLLRFLPSDLNPSSSSDAYRRFKVHSLPVLEPEHLPIPFDQAKAAYELKHNKPLKPVFRHAGKTYPPQGTVGPVAAAIYPLPFTKKIKGYAVFLPPLFCSINSITRSNSSSN